MKKVLIFLLLGMFLISFTSALTTENLVSYYKFDENAANTTVTDIHGSNTGISSTNTANLFSTPGVINSEFDYDGATEYVNATGFTSLNNGDRSISFWVAADDWTDNSNMFNSDETEAAMSVGINSVSIVFGANSLGNPNPGRRGFSSSTLINGTSYHLAVTINSSNEIVAIYLNGISQAVIINNSWGLDSGTMIGARQSTSPEFFFDGKIDEMSIFNKTLTETEVNELYNFGDGLAYPFTSTDLTIILNTPLNNTLQSSNVTFNASLTPSDGFNLTNATIIVWDSDGDVFFINTTIVLGNTTNTTSFIVGNLTAGDYEWNVFGSSENGTGFLSTNFSEFNNTFTWVPFLVDNEIFELIVLETSRQEFLLNITTLPSVLSVNAILNYNGTRFTADTSCTAGLCQISTAIDIPLVSTGESENKSFLWEISIFDGTNSFSTNLTANEQNVTRLRLEECGGSFTTQTLNFTSFDEQTELAVSPFSFDGSFEFWLGTGTIKRSNIFSNSSLTSLQLCLSPVNETLFLDGTIEYDEASGTNYTQRNYFFQNDTINNVSQDIELGLLLAEDSTSFILKVQDRDILPVANVVIFTERFYPGEGVFRVVQVSQTDDNGATVGFFETETVEYRFVLKQNGATVLITNKQKIVGESVPFTLTFTIGEDEGAAWEPFEEIDDLDSVITFNKTSNIVSFTYLDTSGNFSLARLIVEKVNASGLQNTVICSETSVQSSATITCNVTGNSTGQYIARGIITRNGVAQLVEQGSFAIEDFSTISGRLGLFLGWFIILIAIFAFKFNEVAGIILTNLAIIFVNLIGLISFGYVFISAMVAISIIILVVLER